MAIRKLGWAAKVALLALAITGVTQDGARAVKSYSFVVFNALTNKEVFRTFGRAKDEQPLFITKVIDLPNSAYTMVEVTPNNAGEENQIVGLAALNRLRILTIDTVETYYDRGELVTVRSIERLGEVPPDAFIRQEGQAAGGGKK